MKVRLSAENSSRQDLCGVDQNLTMHASSRLSNIAFLVHVTLFSRKILTKHKATAEMNSESDFMCDLVIYVSC